MAARKNPRGWQRRGGTFTGETPRAFRERVNTFGVGCRTRLFLDVARDRNSLSAAQRHLVVQQEHS